MAQLVKNPSANAHKRLKFNPWVTKVPWRTPVLRATHSSVLAWKIP